MTRISRAGKIFLRTFVLVLMIVMLYASSAFAADARSWSEIVNLVQSTPINGSVNIKLIENVTAISGLDIGGKNVTIDLNGKTITVENGVDVLFNGGWNSQLTIEDSQTITVQPEKTTMPERFEQNMENVPNGTGIGRAAFYEKGVLTYYETRSTVDTIYTSEKHYEVKVTVKGGIVRKGSSDKPLISIGNPESSVTIKGGFFHNPTGRAIESLNGADVTITGGIFYGCNKTDGCGGAVYVECWNEPRPTVTVVGGIFAGNSAQKGGALATNSYGKAELTIGEGAVFSGNKATGDQHAGGGAIFIGQGTVATMSGGLVTHNWCTDNVFGAEADSSSYDVRGGGILVHGSLLMTGGQVTSNEAAGGGGISTVFWDGGVFAMTGGIVARNYARLNEGGGICIDINGLGAITGGHITNNCVEGREHWGGGGIFNANGSTLTMLNTLIAKNTAGGFGGGLAGCSTSRIDTHDTSINVNNHSVAIYDNKAEGRQLSGSGSTKNEDHIYAASNPVFKRVGKYNDYFCALSGTVCGGFLGNGNANWSGTIDGQEIKEGDIKPGVKVTSQSVAGLNSNPSPNDVKNAISVAKVFVTGNSSATHGGGILCNGYLIIGPHRSMEIGDRMELDGKKTLNGGKLEHEFTFIVADGEGNVLFTGKNDASGNIDFNDRLVFDKAGTYTYKVYESAEDFPGVRMDDTVYTIEVVVTKDTIKHDALDPNNLTQIVKEAITVSFYKISKVTVTKTGESDPILEDNNASSQENGAYILPEILNFTNTVSDEPEETGDLTVTKTVVSDAAADKNAEFSFTVTLNDATINDTYGDMDFTNGVATFKLKHDESITAIGLPTGIGYTVTETESAGFTTTSTGKTGTIRTTASTAEFTNTRMTGDLTVTKTVVSDAAADENAEFSFTVTLDDATINGTYGDMTFTDGVATFKLKHGEYIVAEDLPTGITYTVTETESEGFTTPSTAATGTISTTASTAAFTNTRKTGDLKVSKTVESDVEGDYDLDFSFTVTLDDATINGTYGDMTFTNGVATFTLKHGESKKAEGLPTGVGYTVAEAASDDFTTTSTGTTGTISTAASTAAFTNTRMNGGLTVTKTVVSSVAADKNTDFGFTVTLSDQTINGTYGDMTFTNGVATFNLKDGESKTAIGLPTGIGYTVAETANDRFTTTSTGATGTISTTASTAAFTNTRKTGDLKVSKTVESDVEGDYDLDFSFTVTLDDATINGTYGDMTFTNGVATFNLKDGESKTATGLPIDITYVVTETASADFTTTSTGEIGMISSTASTAAFTNTRMTGGLTVTKTVVSAEAADKNTDFSFAVTLSEPSINGTYEDMTFTNGVATFTLKDGESKTAIGLPIGITYVVTETASAGFTTTSTGETGTISTAASTAAFINTREEEEVETGSLTVSKMVVSDVEADYDLAFSFTVTLDDATINGTYGGMTFTDGVATFNLKDGESVAATGLPTGITYMAAETASDGFNTTFTGETGTITANASAAVFTNTRKVAYGNLRVSKTVTGDGSKMQPFGFTVTLTDPTINGTYGEMTFADGVARFELAHGQSKTAVNLPAGIGYVVTEDPGEYIVDQMGDVGIIPDNGTASAEFINQLIHAVEYGDLNVSKTITGTSADMSQKFTFRVTLNSDVTGTFGNMTFTNGVATFQLGHNETAVAIGLPAGIRYTVEELDSGEYTVSAFNETGNIMAGSTQFVTFVNDHSVPELPATGDDSRLALLCVMFALSTAGFVLLQKKRQHFNH